MSMTKVLRNARLESGKLQKQIAAECFMSRETYNLIEIRGSIRSCHVKNVCKALNLTPNELFEWEAEYD